MKFGPICNENQSSLDLNLSFLWVLKLILCQKKQAFYYPILLKKLKFDKFSHLGCVMLIQLRNFQTLSKNKGSSIFRWTLRPERSENKLGERVQVIQDSSLIVVHVASSSKITCDGMCTCTRPERQEQQARWCSLKKEKKNEAIPT